MKIHIGCSGWQYYDWKGIFYPETLPQKDWFQYYASQFDSVEINSNFYHFPRLSTIEKWYAAAPEGFLYSLKAPRFFTHYQKFVGTDEQLKDFYQTVGALKEKLGCILFQFPASLHYNADFLERILAALDPVYQNVLEFRHASWWNEQVYTALQQKGISLCHVSAPAPLPQDPILGRNFYLRFHGPKQWFRGKHPEAELEAWLDKIQANQAEQAWIYFNNTMEGAAIENALYLKTLILESTQLL